MVRLRGALSFFTEPSPTSPTRLPARRTVVAWQIAHPEHSPFGPWPRLLGVFALTRMIGGGGQAGRPVRISGPGTAAAAESRSAHPRLRGGARACGRCRPASPGLFASRRVRAWPQR